MRPFTGFTAAEVEGLRIGAVHDTWTPEHWWAVKVLASDLAGIGATQRTTVTVPAAGFVTGRLTITFAGGGLGAPVIFTEDAAVGTTNTALLAAAVIALTVLVGTTLAGVLAATSTTSDELFLDLEPWIGEVSITAVFTPAQQIDATIAGTLIDGDYVSTFSGGGLGAPVVVTSVRAAGMPATISTMIQRFESDIEGEAGLTGVLVSADEDTVDGNLLIFEPGIAPVVLALTLSPNSIALQFGGTETDGAYVTTFAHSTLPGGTAAVTTARAGGTPATNALLAVQHEADIEADPRLAPLIFSADDDAVDSCIVITYPGVTGLTATTAAPSPGTLTQTPLSWTGVDATPAGPAVTVAGSFSIALNVLHSTNEYLVNSLRMDPVLLVDTAFAAGTTASLDDAGAASTDVLDAVPIDAVGAVSDTGTSLGDTDVVHAAWAPRLTITLPDGAAIPTIGELRVAVAFAPLPE